MHWRFPSSARPGRAARAALAAAVVLSAFLAGCNDPSSPGPSTGAADFRGDYDTSGKTLRFQLGSPGGEASDLELVASNLTYDPGTAELHAAVAIRNSGADAVPGPGRVLVGDFQPPEVQPLNATPLPCPLCPGCPCPWPWAFDHAGTYGEDGMLAPGETSSPVEWILHVPNGDSFSFRARLDLQSPAPRPGVISGSVFVDGNRNGRRDLGEAGIAGAVLSLVHGEGGASAVSDDNGRYAFEVSEEGLYQVSWNAADCASPTTPLERQVFIVRRPDGTLSGYDGVDFGCAGSTPPDSTGVEVQGIVFEDLNRNGARDPGEPGIPGVRIDGAVPTCPTFAPVVAYTDAQGAYRMSLFGCSPPYIITREPLAGFVDTTPNPVVFDRLPIPNGGSGPSTTPPRTGPHVSPLPPIIVLQANFGVARSAPGEEFSVEGFVYLDANRNGKLDDGETGISDVGVSAGGLECMTPVIGLTRTDATGHYVLRQTDIHCMPPWIVRHDEVGGHCDTSANPVIVGAYPMPPFDSRTFRVDFGVAPCDSVPPPPGLAIDGFVWYDSDRDGVRDPDESGVQGAQVQLLSPCDRLWVAYTDASGHYAFDSAGACAVLAVVVIRPAGLVFTTPNPHPVDPNAVPPDGVLHVDFGVVPMRR